MLRRVRLEGLGSFVADAIIVGTLGGVRERGVRDSTPLNRPY